MSIWGKILGGAAGFALGGPLGALIGAVAGHAVDKMRQAPREGAEDDATRYLRRTSRRANFSDHEGFPYRREILSMRSPMISRLAVLSCVAAAPAFFLSVDFSVSANAEPLRAQATLQRFYQTRNAALAWTGPANTAAYRELVAAIGAADRHGLDPADYHLAELANGNPETGALRLDQVATDAYVTLAAHLLSGRLDPLTIEPNWTAARRGRDLAAYLESSLGNGAIMESLDALAPTQSGYADLRNALARYREIAWRGGWPKVGEGKAMRVGDRGQRVAQLRKRLAATGDPVNEGSDPELFDVQLVEAVRRFQQQTNLEPDGIVGARTLAQLNASVEDRIAQIRANMER